MMQEDQAAPAHPFEETHASKMLRRALQEAAIERGMSIRKVGKQLGYKQATVLSHMATGRVPIPLDRAMEFATQLQMPAGEFLLAALEQRVPGAAQAIKSSRHSPASDFAAKLELIAGLPLDQLPQEHREVLMEVVAERYPRRRWLSLPALRAVLEIQGERPSFQDLGLSEADLDGVIGILKDLR